MKTELTDISRYYNLKDYILQYYAALFQSATTTVLVTVTDINDNNPVFTTPQPIEFKVQENRVNELVGTVSATDADLGVNGQVSYSLLNDNE